MRRPALPVTALDLLLAAACLSFAAAELLVWDEWSPTSRVVQVAAIVVAGVALAVRRRAPLGAVVLLAATALLLVSGGNPPQLLALGLAGVVVSYSVGAGLDGPRLVVASALLAGAVVLRDVVDPTLNGFDVVIDLLFFSMPWVVGRVVRRRERRVDVVARAADARAEDAIRHERERIARELHDVVAHGLTVMVVQADSARHCLGPEEGEAHAALAEIERTGRESLGEMRRLLGLLRSDAPDEEEAELTPKPGMHALDALVRSVRSVGLPVELRIAGPVRPLPSGMDLAAYRIVQESLTNALRHAGPTRARVDVRYTDRALELTIEDSGSGNGSTGRLGDAGRGLIGMSERARLYGGSFHAAPGPHGFVVRASLPIESSP